MATVNIDLSGFKRGMDELKAVLANTDQWLRPLVVELSGVMHTRIHDKGLDAQDRPIGTYSVPYLAYRKRNKLGTDPKIILVNTRKLQNSWTVLPTNNGWGIGFVDEGATKGVTSYDKIHFTELRIGRRILDLAPSEIQYIEDRLNQIIPQLLP